MFQQKFNGQTFTSQKINNTKIYNFDQKLTLMYSSKGKMRLKTLQSIVFSLIITTLFIRQASMQSQDQVYKLKQTFTTGLTLNHALSVSPLNSYIIVGGEEGICTIYDYETGEAKEALLEHRGSPITSIVWENDRSGLVTVSVNPENNNSLAIQRDRYNFSQIHRWTFNVPIFKADSTHDRFDSFVGFAAQKQIFEYNLRTRNQIRRYRVSEGISDMAYAGGHSYLFVANEKYLYSYRCQTGSGSYFGSEKPISNLATDKQNMTNAPVIYKRVLDDTFYIYDPIGSSDMLNQSQGVKFYKYCFENLIISVGTDQCINILTKSKQPSVIAKITSFVDGEVQVLGLECANGHVAVTTSENKVYVYEIMPQPDDDPMSLSTVIAIVLGVLVFISVVAMILYKKVYKKKRQAQRSLIESLEESER